MAKNGNASAIMKELLLNLFKYANPILNTVLGFKATVVVDSGRLVATGSSCYDTQQWLSILQSVHAHVTVTWQVTSVCYWQPMREVACLWQLSRGVICERVHQGHRSIIDLFESIIIFYSPCWCFWNHSRCCGKTLLQFLLNNSLTHRGSKTQ